MPEPIHYAASFLRNRPLRMLTLRNGRPVGMADTSAADRSQIALSVSLSPQRLHDWGGVRYVTGDHGSAYSGPVLAFALPAGQGGVHGA